jgi:FMN-dependent NADH-azoreductase
LLGLPPRFIAAELTMADVTPEMAAFKPLAAESLTAADGIDPQWETDAVAAYHKADAPKPTRTASPSHG